MQGRAWQPASAKSPHKLVLRKLLQSDAAPALRCSGMQGELARRA